jgi:hypothetical protein
MNAFFAIAAITLSGLHPAPLFAAGIEWVIYGILFVIFVVVPALGKVLSGMKAPPPPKGGDRPMRPARPAASGSVQNEIEEFLRRANQKNAVGTNRPQRPPPRAKPPEKPGRSEIVRAEAVGERPVGGEVEKHVKQYLDKEEFVRRAKNLGEEVAEADDKIERRLKSVFDHSLGKIAATPGETASSPDAKLADSAPQLTVAMPSVAAGDVAALFSNPLSVRQAVIISEILNRPLERWEREGSFNQAAWDRRET